MSAKHVFLITDPDLRIVGQPLQWKTFDAFLPYNSVGAIVATVDGTDELLDLITQPDYRLCLVEQPDQGPGRILASGPLEKPGAYKWAEGEQASGPGLVTIAAGTNELYLAERITYPNPAVDAESQTGVARYLLPDSTNVEVGLRALVDGNAGPGALANRRVRKLVLGALAGVAGTAAVSTRFEPLDECLNTTAAAAADDLDGVGWRVVDTGTELQFVVYQTVYRRDAVFGRARNNIASLSVDPEAPTATVAIAGGTGEGTARLIVEEHAATSWRRMETFVNQNGIDDSTVLIQAAREALADAGEKAGISVEVGPDSGLRPFVDYWPGDRVPVVLRPGVLLGQQVTSIKISGSADGTVTTVPAIGLPNPTSQNAAARIARLILRRLGRTERT